MRLMVVPDTNPLNGTLCCVVWGGGGSVEGRAGGWVGGEVDGSTLV